ncbi:unnamed protein product [Amoebophrya sp. A25]|nr:unnamed protein product [Amoebophrya sp. A25]|eukprot:GSA25T00016257001.1
MEAFRARYQSWAMEDASLHGWWIQDQATGKQASPLPHQLLLRAVTCQIDGSTLCYKQGITDNWTPIAEVPQMREGISKLESNYENDSEMAKLVEALPKRPTSDSVPFDHQHTNHNCELLIFDIIDECWRPVADYDLLVAAETERLALEAQVEVAPIAINPGSNVADTPLAEFLASVDAGIPAAAATTPAASSVGNHTNAPVGDTSSVAVALGGAAQQHPEANSADAGAGALTVDGGTLSKNAAKRKRWKEKKKLEKQAGLWNAGKNISDIYLSQLPLSITEAELVDIFSKCGVIKDDAATRQPSIKLYTKEGTAEKRGDALIKFLRKESADEAIKQFHERELKTAAGETSTINVQRAEYQKQQLSTEELKARIAETKTEWNDAAQAKKKKNDWARSKQLHQKLYLDEDDSKRAQKLKSQIVLRNLFDAETIAASGRNPETYIDELREDLLEDYLDWNPQARRLLDVNAKAALLPKQNGQAKPAVKPPLRILAFLGAGQRGFVTVQFADVVEAEMYKTHYHGRKFDGRTVYADFHDGVDLKKDLRKVVLKAAPAASSTARPGVAADGIPGTTSTPECPGAASTSEGGRRTRIISGDAEMAELESDEDEDPEAKRRRRADGEPTSEAGEMSMTITEDGQAYAHVQTNDDWLFNGDSDDDEDED